MMGLYFNIALFLPFEKINEKEITFLGIVLEKDEPSDYSNKYLVKLKQVNLSKNNIKKFKNINIYMNTKKEMKFEVGDSVSGAGEFKLGEENRNYRGFNNREYLIQRKVHGTINVDSSVKKIKNICNLDTFFYKVKNLMIKSIEDEFDNENRDFLLCVLIGKTIRNNELKEDFRNSNLSHILAISGMHVSYIILGINFIKIKNKRFLLIIELITLSVYFFITGESVSCLRACMMNSLLIISKLTYRKNNIYISGISVLMFSIIYNVYNISNAGMWLSFGGMFGIILFNKFIYKFVIFKFKIRNKIIKKVIKISSVPISAQIMIFPIMMYFFNTISFNFIISNLATFFLIGSIIILGYVTIFFALLRIVFIVDILKIIENKLVSFFIKATKIIGTNFNFNMHTITPNILSVITYYLIIILIIFLWKKEDIKIKRIFLDRKRSIAFFKNKIVIIFIILFVLLNFVLNSNLNINKDFKTNFVDVGQGDCTLITTPQNKKILIDGGEGNSDKYDYGKNVLFPYLLDRKIQIIDYLIVSHFDSDHVRWTNIYIRKYESKKRNNWCSV